MPDISDQHLLAMMLVDGNVTFASAHDYARMKDPRVLAFVNALQRWGIPH